MPCRKPSSCQLNSSCFGRQPALSQLLVREWSGTFAALRARYDPDGILGYALAIDPAGVDAFRFRQLLDEADGALASSSAALKAAKQPPGDFRDWSDVPDWADSIAEVTVRERT